MKIRIIFLLFTGYLIFGSPLSGFCQKAKIATEKGNKALKAGDIEAARSAYENALELDPNFKEARFNLGNSYLMESRGILAEAGKMEDQQKGMELAKSAQEISKKAAAAFESVSANATDADEINKAQYNLGNANLLGGELDKSIENYKEALRKVPTDEAARYNLAYAKHLKKKQENQKQDQDQDQKDDQQKDDKKDEKQKDQDKKDEKQEPKEQEPKKDELSKEEAEKMLQALMKQEKDLQEDLNKKKRKAQPIKIEKDW